MSAHTPGPWFNARDLWACITTAPLGFGDVIAEVSRTPPDDEQRANARLIAAAPDLLAALILAQDTLGDLEGSHWNEVMGKLDAAIAKAEVTP